MENMNFCSVKTQKTIDWADRQCRKCSQCRDKRAQDEDHIRTGFLPTYNNYNMGNEGGILRQRNNPDIYASTPSLDNSCPEIHTAAAAAVDDDDN